MAANTKHRKGFKERKARNRRLLDEARNHQMNKRNNMIKMIQEQMLAAQAKENMDPNVAKYGPHKSDQVISQEMPMDGTVVKIGGMTEDGKPIFIQDEETKEMTDTQQVDPNA